jgi:hypothetical protein
MLFQELENRIKSIIVMIANNHLLAMTEDFLYFSSVTYLAKSTGLFSPVYTSFKCNRFCIQLAKLFMNMIILDCWQLHYFKYHFFNAESFECFNKQYNDFTLIKKIKAIP